ncbi:universal stress protein [Acuticoccus sp. MNP-M23]|uniref:universal stress protein n=1 Tax=Acuticoccus sp. MNP-M23 TaxID=3072793 RepID=UPI002815A080|nr:universal stress protein [Acuticoccus sp. MNP-M23]WMS44274.1 universal stress protein [Acuticoccus sp. MNP-M23]
MYRTIMVPVDMAHVDRLDRSLQVCADLAKLYSAEVVYVGVTTEAPSEIAHTPAEFEARLKAFAEAETATHGHKARVRAYASHDPTSDLNHTLIEAVDDTGADLIVMAGYLPSFADHFRRSHESVLLNRTKVSLLVVR